MVANAIAVVTVTILRGWWRNAGVCYEFLVLVQLLGGITDVLLERITGAHFIPLQLVEQWKPALKIYVAFLCYNLTVKTQ